MVAGGEEPRVVPPRPGRAALAALRAIIREGVVADARTQRGGRAPSRLAPASAPASLALAPAPVRLVPAAAPSPLAAALTRVARLARSTGIVVVVSDFRDEGWAAPLRACAARHTVLAVEVTDPAEAELPAAGLLTLVDPESGQVVEADTSAPRLREAYAGAESERRAAVATSLRGARADHLVLSTERDWLRDLGRRMS